jgi:hypothetical protein
MGVRFEHKPGSPPSDLIIHVALREPTAAQQQQSVGVLGVNLLYAAAYARTSRQEMLASLLNGLSIDRIEIDVAECSGPAFGDTPSNGSEAAVELLEHGLGRAVIFDEQGRMGQPSEVLHGRPLVVHRCSLARENPELYPMLDAATRMLKSEVPDEKNQPLRLLELSLQSALGDRSGETGDAGAARVEELQRPGHALMVTRWAESYELTAYVRRTSSKPIRFVIGLDMAVQMLRDNFYHRIDGGMLEGLGRLLAPNVKVYVFSMPAAALEARLDLYETDRDFCRFPAGKVEVSLDDIDLAPPVGKLLGYLRETGWLVQARV